MRKSLLAIAALMLTGVAALAAEQTGHQRSDKAVPSGKLLPLKGATSGSSCAAYGAGFIKIEGSDTCIKIGGAVGVGAGTSAGSR
jgi:hypothetical protein